MTAGEPEPSIGRPPAPDVATLRHLYGEALTRIDIARHRTDAQRAELAALPPIAAAVVAFFFSAKPEDTSLAFDGLFGLAVLLFALLAIQCVRGINAIALDKKHAELVRSEGYAGELQKDDYLDEASWLQHAVVAWRMAATITSKFNAEHALYVRQLRILFATLVIYSAAVTLAASIAA